ncbi:MAG: ATP-binding protein [Bryobacteraceae bacterium]|jgi:two-component system sensor histidine kinase KdpD
MQRLNTHGFWRTLKWCAFGTLGVVLLTSLAYRLHLSFATASFCSLLLLVLQSLSGNFASSAVVSVLAVGCLDYFFLDPLFSLQINSPLDTLGLAAFLITGLVITKLVTKLRDQTELSRRHHERLQRLYALAQQLLALEPDPQGGSHFLEPFCGSFGIRAVCLFDAAGAEVHLAGAASDGLEKQTGEAFLHGKDDENLDQGVATRCIRVGGRTIGAIGFEGLEDPSLTAGPLAALAAAHLERTHSFAHASRAAAAAQTESYRSAILDALAHEFKTPLSTILTAAGALGEAECLGPPQRELAETVESEAARLGRLTSRLIRTARLEREEVRPWIELIDVTSVLADTVDQYTKVSANRSISIVKDCESSEVMGDPELVRLAVSQLLDNACKYSSSGSTVMLRVSREHDQIAVRVLSSGNPIPPSEKGKIFDRFYRGMDGLRVGPGSGLGLFVARKIAVALGGGLELDGESGASDDTVFRLVLPVPESEPEA